MIKGHSVLLIGKEDQGIPIISKFLENFGVIPFDWQAWETNLYLSHWRDLNVVVVWSEDSPPPKEARQWFTSIIDLRKER